MKKIIEIAFNLWITGTIEVPHKDNSPGGTVGTYHCPARFKDWTGRKEIGRWTCYSQPYWGTPTEEEKKLFETFERTKEVGFFESSLFKRLRTLLSTGWVFGQIVCPYKNCYVNARRRFLSGRIEIERRALARRYWGTPTNAERANRGTFVANA